MTGGHKTIFDVALGSAGASMPWWVDFIHGASVVYASLGGAVLVTLRLLDWWRGKRRDDGS